MSWGDFWWIVLVVGILGSLGLILGLIVQWKVRDRSIAVMFTLTAVLTVVVMVAGIVWITVEMIFEETRHGGELALTVAGTSSLVGLAIALLLGRRVSESSRRLVEAVQRVPEHGEYVRPEGVLPAELATISAALAETHERLREARQNEQTLEESRRELVAWVSHDLRTPLAGVRAMAEALEDGVVSDEETIHRYHARIKREADRLAGMVDDLFELARIQAGALRLSRGRVGLDRLVDDTLSVVEPLARAKHVRLTGRATQPASVEADPDELGRALRNLVGNAIRHTPSDGTVSVNISVDGGKVLVSVCDACGGIPEEDLPRVFDVAFRGSSARTPEPGGGAGLGLAIARGIIEAHEGVIDVANAGPGCRFEVRLPLAAP